MILLKKNIRAGKINHYFLVLILYFIIFSFLEVKSNENLDGSKIDLKVLDKISSKNELINLLIGEDFIFDPDDAIANPSSDSAKVLNATIDGVVQRRLSNELAKQKQEFNLERNISDFRQKHNMNDSEWNEFRQFADNQKLSLDDIYYLKNRGQREDNIARTASNKALNQVRNTQSKPKSLATQGSAKVETSEEGQIFDAILGIDKQLDNAFG